MYDKEAPPEQALSALWALRCKTRSVCVLVIFLLI
jgi:hypothetical protein